jgi:hypothetical protein
VVSRSKRVVKTGQEYKIVCGNVLMCVLLCLLPHMLSAVSTSILLTTVTLRNIKVNTPILYYEAAFSSMNNQISNVHTFVLIFSGPFHECNSLF